MSFIKQSVLFGSLLFYASAPLPALESGSNPPEAKKDFTMAAKAAGKSPAASENPAPNSSAPPTTGTPGISQKEASLRVMENMARTLVTQNIVRLNITAQAFDFARPWSKRAPMARKALGTVLPGNQLLCTAEAIANSTYIELESPDGENKQPATVVCVDYEANLALLKPDSADFLRGKTGFGLTQARVGDPLTACQLESNGNLLLSRGQMTTAEVMRYPIDESAFLVCRASCPLQMKDATLAIPVLKDAKVVGLMLRYDAQSSLLDIIPSVVIEHFLKDSKDGKYDGFPRMGCTFAPTRDPQLRRYLKLSGNNSGVLITQVASGGPSAAAGIMKGDVILEIAGQAIDSDGNYRDADYGRISLGHLVSTRHMQQDSVPVRLLRDGKEIEVSVKVTRKPVEEYLSEPYIIDRGPRYYVLGGLVLQELSRQYLKEFGNDWTRKAPLELLHFDRIQSELEDSDKKKLVMISRVLPSNVTIGYEDIRHVLVNMVNDVPIKSLSDIPEALKSNKDGLIKIELASDPSLIFLDAKAVDEITPVMRRSYGITSMSRLE
jgi:hypothetical protein